MNSVREYRPRAGFPGPTNGARDSTRALALPPPVSSPVEGLSASTRRGPVGKRTKAASLQRLRRSTDNSVDRRTSLGWARSGSRQDGAPARVPIGRSSCYEEKAASSVLCRGAPSSSALQSWISLQ